MNIVVIKYLQFIFLLYILLSTSFAQNSNIHKYQFISPQPGSSMNLPLTTIILREGNLIEKNSLSKNDIVVRGSKSGILSGKIFVAEDLKTIIFKPSIPFKLGETVNVNLHGEVKTIEGEEFDQLQFSFRICDKIVDEKLSLLKDEYRYDKKMENGISTVIESKNHSYTDSLPDYFPPLIVNVSNNPTPGYLFISPFSSSGAFIYRMIIDNNGIPVYYSKVAKPQGDFKVQPNGLLTYYDLASRTFRAMDSSYTVIDSFACGNGYPTDDHEFLLFPNGHSFLMSYDWQPVRMDTIVPGGDPNAIVIGLIVQELDADKNVIFQWRSWDHFEITDATEDIDLTAHTIDYVHGNAIELDEDGNLLISSRHLDEITKINRQSGEIIWRLGGLKSRNNQFQFIGDPRTFSHQHDIRRLSNGNITLFDNGNLHIPSYSRSLEYHLDEATKTATLVWAFQNEPPNYFFAMGSARKLSSNNTLIGWGWGLENTLLLTEVRDDGSIAFELSMPDSFANYRALRFPWKTNLFVANPDSIFFSPVEVGDSSSIFISVFNNSNEELTVTGFYHTENSYSINKNVPFTLQPFGSEQIEIKFKPSEDGYFRDTLHIRVDTDSSRIAQIVDMIGVTDSVYLGIETIEPVDGFLLLQNYPNPFNSETKIDYKIAENGFVKIQVYDVLGKELEILVNEIQQAGDYKINFNAQDFSSGVYFYKLHFIPENKITSSYISVKKMIFLK